MTMYFAVFATKRTDLSEWIVSLVSTEALARVVGWEMLDARPWLVRCRVRRVYLTRKEVFTVVERWGQEDAARGRPLADAEKLPEPFRTVYLSSYMAAQRGTE